MPHVLSTSHTLQIVNVIVGFIAILVVDLYISKQWNWLQKSGRNEPVHKTELRDPIK